VEAPAGAQEAFRQQGDQQRVEEVVAMTARLGAELSSSS
jgi:hypothetical protein